MTARSTRLVGLTATGTLLAGMVAAPPAIAAAGGVADPAFYQVVAASSAPSATSASERRSAAATLAAKATVKKSKGEQILQNLNAAGGVGNAGLAVATGPKNVAQVAGTKVRMFVKATGKQVGPTTLNALMGFGGTVDVSQGTLAYDPVGKRWFAVAVTDDAGDIGLAVRVSKGTNPAKLSKWHAPLRTADASSSDSNPNVTESSPRVGVSSDKVVITAVADDPDDVSIVERILFFPKNGLITGGAPDPWVADLNSTYDGQAPAVNGTSQANIFVAVPDVSDITVTTYTGAATSKPPNFSKSVMYPNDDLLAPPTVVQGGGGDDIDLGPLAFNSVAWRSGKLWAVAAAECSFATPTAHVQSCIRAFGVTTASGVALTAEETLKADGRDWFSPSVAIDGAGYVHVGATDVLTGASGPNFAVFARKGANNWTSPRFVALAQGEFDDGNVSSTSSWSGGTAAAIDPTSPWDVWVSGAVGDLTAAADPNLTSSVARVSLAKNKASLKTSATKVNKGHRVTFTAKLSRPGSKDVIKGLPIALQTKPVKGGSWTTVQSVKTSAEGTAKWKLKIKKAGLYRTFGKAVKQVGGQGKVFDKALSKAKKISLK